MIGVRFPDDFFGKTCLDIGGYDGGMAAACLAHGATSAVVVDNEEWRQYGWGEPARVPGPDYRTGDLFDWTEPADVVICSNVIYHVRDWRAGLARLRTLTRGTLYLRTSFVTDGPDDGWKRYDDGMGHSNGTVWCRPTPAGLVAGLRAAGFVEVVEQGREGDHIVVECS